MFELQVDRQVGSVRHVLITCMSVNNNLKVGCTCPAQKCWNFFVVSLHFFGLLTVTPVSSHL